MEENNKALDAMIKISLGTANSQDRELVESLSERTFSTLYAELEDLVDNNYAVEDYYKIKAKPTEPGPIEIEDNEDCCEEEEDTDEDFEREFKLFYQKNRGEFESKDEAYKYFCDKYMNQDSDEDEEEEYSDHFYSEEDFLLKEAILEEYSEFLSLYGDDYEDEEDAYSDYVNNYTSF